jgi:hypothetical protein
MHHDFSRHGSKEDVIFELVWKAALFLCVFFLELSVFLNIPGDMPVPMKALIWLLLLFTVIQLFFVLTYRTREVRKHAAILFAAGFSTILIGIWMGKLAIG